MRFSVLVAVSAGLFSLASPSLASCFGSGTMQTCTDDSGNSYTTQRFGNQSITNGYNANTGSNWSQNSITSGNNTFTNGTAANGNPWSATETRMGNSRSISGVDSRGNSFSAFCTPAGCN